MAWPRTGRYFSFSPPPATEMVSSAFLNEIQDQIVLLYNCRNIVCVAASNANAGSKAVASYVCDGTADEVEINTALAYVGARGLVLLSEGTFNLADGITLSGAQSLQGQGAGATTLLVTTGSAADFDLVTMGAALGKVADLCIDGNWGSVTGEHNGLVISGANNNFERVVVKRCNLSATKGIGILSQADGQTFFACRAESNIGVGIQIENDDNKIFGCLSQANGEHGIKLTTASDAIVQGCRVDCNSAAADDTSSGIYVAGGANQLITGNIVRRGSGNMHKYGIELADAPNSPTDCLAFGNDLHLSGKTSSAYPATDGGNGAKTMPEWVTSDGGTTWKQNNLLYGNYTS